MKLNLRNEENKDSFQTSGVSLDGSLFMKGTSPKEVSSTKKVTLKEIKKDKTLANVSENLFQKHFLS